VKDSKITFADGFHQERTGYPIGTANLSMPPGSPKFDRVFELGFGRGDGFQAAVATWMATSAQMQNMRELILELRLEVARLRTAVDPNAVPLPELAVVPTTPEEPT
jgi:hypothetical protein